MKTKLFLALSLWDVGIWNQALSCSVLMAVGSGHLESSKTSAWAEQGFSWCYPLDLLHSWPQEKRENPECWMERGGLRPFYSSEFPSDLVRRQSGALKTCHMREETEIGSSILSQDLRTSCYKTVSEFSPLGKLLTSWRRMPDPVENLMSYKKLESLGKILRKLRSLGLFRASPTHCLFLPHERYPSSLPWREYCWHYLGGSLT